MPGPETVVGDGGSGRSALPTPIHLAQLFHQLRLKSSSLVCYNALRAPKLWNQVVAERFYSCCHCLILSRNCKSIHKDVRVLIA